MLADVTMLAHFAFLVYLAVGGFIAWRWPRTIVLHLAVVSWGMLIVVFNLTCPLTGPEDYFRTKAGQGGLPGGFIDTYIDGVIYPAQYVNHVRALVALIVLISWIGLVIRLRRARNSRRAAL